MVYLKYLKYKVLFDFLLTLGKPDDRRRIGPASVWRRRALLGYNPLDKLIQIEKIVNLRI